MFLALIDNLSKNQTIFLTHRSITWLLNLFIHKVNLFIQLSKRLIHSRHIHQKLSIPTSGIALYCLSLTQYLDNFLAVSPQVLKVSDLIHVSHRERQAFEDARRTSKCQSSRVVLLAVSQFCVMLDSFKGSLHKIAQGNSAIFVIKLLKTCDHTYVVSQNDGFYQVMKPLLFLKSAGLCSNTLGNPVNQCSRGNPAETR